jgi:integrase
MGTKVSTVRRPGPNGGPDVVYDRLTRGSASVTLHTCRPKGKKVFYTLVYYLNGERKRPTFANRQAARRAADHVLEQLCNGEAEVETLRGPGRHEYIRAQQALEGTGVPLDVAAREYAAAFKATREVSLHALIAQYLKTCRPGHREARVADVVAELLEARKTDRSSPRHIDDLESRLTRFAKAFECPISSVTGDDIHRFLSGLNLQPRTINNFRGAISNLFRFARLKRYVPKDYAPVGEVPEWKEPQKPVVILTVPQLAEVLRRANPKFIPYLAIAAFAGLRQSEIMRLCWEHIDSRNIRVPPGQHRVKSTRVVPIQPNLLRWLDGCRQASGPVVPYKSPWNEVTEHLACTGVEDRHNALRHSFGSYRLALLKNLHEVAHEMGNSPGVVNSNYREVVTPEQAEAWFALVPASASAPAVPTHDPAVEAVLI